MSTTEYKPHHPVAWGIIAGVALFSAVGVAAIMGWLPTSDDSAVIDNCSECGVIESVRTVEVPFLPDESGTTAEAGTPAEESAAGSIEDAQSAQVAYSYEITVRYDDGSTGVFSQAQPPSWQTGDKVRVVDGTILLSG
jgi:hypothetical protein